jgi:hypothetical protein
MKRLKRTKFLRVFIGLYWRVRYRFKKEEKIEVDLENRLKLYVPDMFTLMGKQGFNWSELNERYGEFLRDRKIKFRLNGNYLRDPVNFYDVTLRSVTSDDPVFQNYFVYINKVFRSLSTILTDDEKIMVNSIIRNLLRQFSRSYTHSLGELFVLNNVMKSEKYRLRKIEYENPEEPKIKNKKGKTIDFLFYSLELKQDILLEVMNVDLKEKTVIDSTHLKLHLERKISDKIKDKKKSFPKFNFNIIPVLWGTSEELRVVYDMYKQGVGPNFDNVMEPFTYGYFYKESGGHSFYKFSPISTFYDEPNSENLIR